MCLSASSVAEGLDLAVKEAGRAGLVVVAGSLFLVGAVIGLLSRDEEGPSRVLK
jgi:folylpolyglutamate synthase/dihydropteroate synthase